MSIDTLIPVDDLSLTEKNVLAEICSNPTFKKYLSILAANDIKDLITLSITERNDAEVAKKHALIQGKLSILATLSSIQKPQSPQE